MSEPYLREIRIDWEKIESKDAHPFSVPSIQKIESIKFPTPITYIIGENGCGKTSLLESIAQSIGLNVEGGNKNTRFSTSDSNNDLYKYIKTIKGAMRPKDWYFLRAESFYNLATYMDEAGYLEGYGGKSLHEQSHGESFMSVLKNKLRGSGFYIFDEPESALSPSKQLEALIEMDRLAKNNSQLIITTHSPILMALPNATIYQLTSEGIEQIEYTDTEHYHVTRNFLNRTSSMLEELGIQ